MTVILSRYTEVKVPTNTQHRCGEEEGRVKPMFTVSSLYRMLAGETEYCKDDTNYQITMTCETLSMLQY